MNFYGQVYWNNITRVLSVSDSPPYKDSIPAFSNVIKRKEKRLQNKDAIFFSTLKASGTDT
jgi:hypothetical protein